MQKIPKNLQEVLALISKLSKALVTGYKVNIKNILYFYILAMNNSKLKYKTVRYTITSKLLITQKQIL